MGFAPSPGLDQMATETSCSPVEPKGVRRLDDADRTKTLGGIDPRTSHKMAAARGAHS